MDLDSDPIRNKESKMSISFGKELDRNHDNIRRSKNIISILLLAAIEGYLKAIFRSRAHDTPKPNSINESALDWIRTVAISFDIIVAIVLLLSRRKQSLQNISYLLWFQAVLVLMTLFELFIESTTIIFWATYFIQIGFSIASISTIYLALTYVYDMENSSLSIIPLIGFVVGIFIFFMSYAGSEDSLLVDILDISKHCGIYVTYCIGTSLVLIIFGFALKYLDKPERLAEAKNASAVICRLFKNPIWLFNAFSTTLIYFSAARVFSLMDYPELNDIAFEMKPTTFTLVNSLVSGLSPIIPALILFKCSTNIQIAKVIFDWLFCASYVVMAFRESHIFHGIFYIVYKVFYGLWPLCSTYITFRNVLSQDRAVALGLEYGLAIFVTYLLPGKMMELLYEEINIPLYMRSIICSGFVGLIAILDVLVLYFLRNKSEKERYLSSI